jgi:preprotein translocase subunit SecF
MKIVPDNINIDFMGQRKLWLTVSGIACGISLVSWAVQGLNLGIDFKGGSSVMAAFKASASPDRDKIEQSINALVGEQLGTTDSQVSVQDFSAGVTGRVGGEEIQRFLIYTEVTSLVSEAKRAEISTKLRGAFGEKTRVDVPEQGADVFYLELPEPGPVPEREATIRGAFKDLGFADLEVLSDVEQALRVECIKEYNLLEAERAPEAEGQAAPGRDPEIARERCEARITEDLKTLSDTRFQVSVQELKSRAAARLATDFPDGFLEVEAASSVSAAVGEDLLMNGLLALLYAIIGILLYVGMRFDFRYAPGAIIALAHDALITIGVFSVFQIKFSMPVVAALLTIVGYSINDTIVTFDRVRENTGAYRDRALLELLNKAVNQTLSRTILTSGTVLFSVLAILILGGGLIQDFALALMVGLVSGTYSTVYIASPLVYYMDGYLKRRGSEPPTAAAA